VFRLREILVVMEVALEVLLELKDEGFAGDHPDKVAEVAFEEGAEPLFAVDGACTVPTASILALEMALLVQKRHDLHSETD
jgi:hypothetical protein